MGQKPLGYNSICTVKHTMGTKLSEPMYFSLIHQILPQTCFQTRILFKVHWYDWNIGAYFVFLNIWFSNYTVRQKACPGCTILLIKRWCVLYFLIPSMPRMRCFILVYHIVFFIALCVNFALVSEVNIDHLFSIVIKYVVSLNKVVYWYWIGKGSSGLSKFCGS